MNYDKYPQLKKFLEETKLTLDQAYTWVEMECKRRKLL